MEKYLKKLVEFYPTTGKQDNVRELLEYVSKTLTASGMQATIYKNQGVHSLYAHPTGKKSSKLLLQAHIDVVPGSDMNVLKVEKDNYKARGVYDMLYATACYLRLIDELRDNMPLLDLGIMLSGDEELGGFNSVPPFFAKGHSAELCFLPDAGAGFGTISVSAKGFFSVQVRIHGTAHHGSRPWEGDGAAIKLTKFLHEADSYYQKFADEDITMTVACLQAGDSDNKGPAYADASLDIRYRSKKQLSDAKKKLHSLLEKYDGVITESSLGSDYHLDSSNPGIKNFLALYKNHIGKDPKEVVAHGSSDARFFAEKNIPVIMVRPDGGGAHGDDEWISVDSIERFYKLLKDFVPSVATIESIK